ncbi:hypothetical protein GN958_ATG22258 [Phytophthora infestans]|uniref:Uncharacterized protein n=1 Tax=Phytophthora infestans TaxID=4787 RepID=A0A8S9TPA4_PHYIN|nr:hypothetical protein GN958_ATG22258 [Phytophthora infestans]
MILLDASFNWDDAVIVLENSNYKANTTLARELGTVQGCTDSDKEDIPLLFSIKGGGERRLSSSSSTRSQLADYSASRYAGITQLRGDLDEAADDMDDEEGDHFVDLDVEEILALCLLYILLVVSVG